MPETQNNVPMLYKAPIILNMKEHANLCYTPTRNFSFAREVNCVPVALGEIPRVLPHYPVVFTDDKEPVLVALLGIRNNENLFVNDDGTWAEGVYIPAYVRRYPFLLVRMQNNDVALGGELDPQVLNDVSGDRLFRDGQPTPAAQEIYRFCMEYQNALEETRKLCSEVAAAGLLKTRTCTVNLTNGKKFRLVGFSSVDEAALDALDNHTANGWRKKHYLKYLYFHLASLERIGDFGVRAEKRGLLPVGDETVPTEDAQAPETVSETAPA